MIAFSVINQDHPMTCSSGINFFKIFRNDVQDSEKMTFLTGASSGYKMPSFNFFISEKGSDAKREFSYIMWVRHVSWAGVTNGGDLTQRKYQLII